MKLFVSEILALEKRRREISKIPFDEIEWVHDDENPFEIDPEVVYNFQLTGLSNCHFPELFLMDQIKDKIDGNWKPSTNRYYPIKSGTYKGQTFQNSGLFLSLTGTRWQSCISPETMNYSMRSFKDQLPADDENNVYFGRIGEKEVLVHVSELWEILADEDEEDE